MTTPSSTSAVEPADPPGTAQRIALRRSFAMDVAVALFSLTTTCAVHACLSSRFGFWQSLPMTLVVVALLVLGVVRCERVRPASLKLGLDELSVWSASGTLLMHGRIAGGALWSGRLLILALAPPAARIRVVLLTADSLPASVFRHLSVLGRRQAGT